TLANSSRARASAPSLHTNRTPRERTHMHGRELAQRVAIESTTEEDTEMARTRKTTATPDQNIVPLRPELEEQTPVDDQPDEQVEPESDEQAEPKEAPERRWRGPALNRVELIGRITKAPDVRVTAGGMHVAYFRVATNGREERDTEFHQ